MIEIGVLADTHVPYRAPVIPDQVVRALAGVALILHAGDVDEPAALAPLQALSPVYAVRGNYHVVERSTAGEADFPASVECEAAGFRIAVNHGYDVVPGALLWKIRAVLRILARRRDFPAYDSAIARALCRHFPRADIIIFGHTHRFYQAWLGKQLLLNPGAALPTAFFGAPFIPSVARVQLEAGQLPRVERICLSR